MYNPQQIPKQQPIYLNFGSSSTDPQANVNQSPLFQPLTFPQPVYQPTNQGLQNTPHLQEVDQNQESLDNNPIMESLFYKQYRAVHSPNELIIFFAILALVFGMLAIFSFFQGLKVKQIQINYATEMKCIEQDKVSQKCSVNFQISQEMAAPIYLIQYITNSYVNHRKFLQSYNVEQLKGKVISVQEAQKSCGKFVFNKEIYSNQSWGNKPLVPQNIASPCGAKSQGYFNDTFSIYSNGAKIDIDQSHIYNRTALHINRAPSSESTQWMDPQNQHYKSYLVDLSLMTKKKRWGIINNNLKPGKYQLIANNNFMLPDMKLNKGVILSTTNVMGGRQVFYPVVFSICGIVCLVYAIFVWCEFKNYSQLKLQQARRSF